ncbi:MAG: alpha/beta hydrolase [Candidatus Heimdallarchaeota archaeon]
MIIEDVIIPYYGSTLSARIFYPSNLSGKVPVVCKVHGLVSNDFAKEEELAAMLTSEGIAYFAFHFTGYSSSPGENTLQTSLSNIDYIISYLATHPKIDPFKIGLYGVSLGGAIATCHSSRDPRIAALALQAPLYDFAFMVNYPKFKAMWEGLVMTGMIRLSKEGRIKEKLQADIIGNNPLVCINNVSPRPIMILAGGKDSFIPLEGIQELYQKAGFPKKYEIVENADHNLTNHLARYETFNLVKKFFIEYLLPKEMRYHKMAKEISVV